MSVAAMMAVTASMAITADGALAAGRSADRQKELQAREAFAAGRYDQALDIFAKLYAETSDPIFMRNIGRCHQRMREPGKAIDAFRDYLAKAKKLPDADRAEVESYIREMEELADRQERDRKVAAATEDTPVVAPVTATPVVASPPLLPLPPPAPPQLAKQKPLGLQVTATATPPSDASSEHAPLYTRWWFWTVIGVAVAAGATTALLLSSGPSRPDCIATMCK